MSTNKILLKFAKKGINLSPEAYNTVINADNPVDFASSLIVKLKSDKFTSSDLISVSGDVVDEITGVKKTSEDKTQKTLTDEPKEVKESNVETPQEEPKKPSMDSFKKESDIQKKHVNEEILEASETVKD